MMETELMLVIVTFISFIFIAEVDKPNPASQTNCMILFLASVNHFTAEMG